MQHKEMNAYVTDPTAPGGLALCTVPVPQPEPHEALIRVEAYSVSRGELTLLKLRPEGFRPGQEAAGVIVQAAADGSGPPVGTRVAGLSRNGTWAEFVAIPATALGIVPAGVDMADAVAVAGSGLMAQRALETLGPIAGKSILVTGAAGAVGNIAVKLAMRAGATVTALVRPDRAGDLRESIGQNVIEGLGPASGPFDAILEGVGGTLVPACIRRLAPGGSILIYGARQDEPSPIVPGDFRDAPGSKLMAMFLWLTDNDTFGRDITALLKTVADGHLSAVVGKRLDWRQTREMIAAMRSGDVLGKTVLDVTPR